MPKIVMKKTTPGCPDGFTTILYRVGEEYDIPDLLASVFVNQIKCAEYVDIKSEKGAPENAMMDINIETDNTDASVSKEEVKKDESEEEDITEIDDSFLNQMAEGYISEGRDMTVEELSIEIGTSVRDILKVMKNLKINGKKKKDVISSEDQDKIIKAL